MGNFLNNGQRRPNIFERARACDNWNEGYVQQQRQQTNVFVLDGKGKIVYNHAGYTEGGEQDIFDALQ